MRISTTSTVKGMKDMTQNVKGTTGQSIGQAFAGHDPGRIVFNVFTIVTVDL